MVSDKTLKKRYNNLVFFLFDFQMSGVLHKLLKESMDLFA